MPDPILTASCSKRKPRLLRRPRKSETSLMIKEVKKVRLQNQTLQQRNQNIQNQHNRRRIRLYKGHERQTRHTHCRMRLVVEKKTSKQRISLQANLFSAKFLQSFDPPAVVASFFRTEQLSPCPRQCRVVCRVPSGILEFCGDIRSPSGWYWTFRPGVLPNGPASYFHRRQGRSRFS